jgi:hypothetical protein
MVAGTLRPVGIEVVSWLFRRVPKVALQAEAAVGVESVS